MADLDSIIADQLASQKKNGALQLQGAPGVASPEGATQALKAAPVLGVKPETLLGDPAGADSMVQEQSSLAILHDSPVLSKWASGPLPKVAATQDDFKNLDLMGKAYKALDQFNHLLTFPDTEDTFGIYGRNIEASWGQLKQDYLSRIPGANAHDDHSFWEQAQQVFNSQLAAGRTVVDAFGLALSPLTAAFGTATQLIDTGAHELIPSTTPGILKQALDQSLVGIGYHGGMPPAVATGEAVNEAAGAFSSAAAKARSGIPRLLSPEAAAAVDAARLKAAEDAVSASKTQARSPELTKEFLAQQGDTEVHIPAQTLVDLETKNPEAIKPFTEGLPDGQLESALARGGDVSLPLSDYLGTVSGTPAADALRDSVRVGEDGVSVAEAKAFKTTPEDIAREHEAEVAPAAVQAVEEAKAQQYLKQLFPDAATAGMSEPQFNAYAKRVQQSTEAATQRLVELTQKQLQREQSAKYKETFATMRAAAEGDIHNRRNVVARSYILYGEHPNGEALATSPIKLDRKVTEGQYSEDLIARLPKGTFGANGVAADDVAELFGFNSGEEMLKAIANLEEERAAANVPGAKAHVEQMVRAEAKRKTRAKLGSLLSPESLRDAAEKAVAEPEAFNFLHDELKALAAQAQLSPLSKEAIAADAAEKFSRFTVAEGLKGRKEFARAAWRNAREAEIALLKGKFDVAFKAKQAQLINQYLLKESIDFEKEFAKANKRFRSWAESPTTSLPQEYTNYIHQALGQIGYRVARDPEELANALGGQSLEDFISRKNSEGQNIVNAPIYSHPVKDMSVAEFRGVADTLASLAHTGREEERIYFGERVEDFKDVLKQAQEQFDKIGKRFTYEQISKPRALGHMARGIDASFLRMETIADLLDSMEKGGIFNQIAIRPTQEAKHLVDDLEDQVKTALREFAKSAPKDFGKDFSQRVDLPYTRGGIPNAVDLSDGDEPLFTEKSQVISFALNLGNLGNRAKTLEGYGLSEADVQKITAPYMTKADWDFVQTLWDQFDLLWPRIEKLYRNLSGVAPPKVKATQVETNFGTYRGGYWPVMYDPLAHVLGGVRSAASIYDPAHFSALPANPYTKGRTNYVAPVSLNLNSFANRIGQIVHDLAYREALLNAQKFLLHPAILKGISQTFGPEYAAQMRPWLEYLANERVFDDKANEVLNNIMQRTRQGVTMVGLGYRISTVLMHGPSALALSIDQVGAKPFVQALYDINKTPWERNKKIKELQAESGELAHRLLNMDASIREQYQQLYEKQGFITFAQHYAFHMVAASDMFSAVPTYLAAKRLAIADGASEADAIAAGDKAVRLAHGSSGAPDIPAVMRSPALKWFTPFMSFMNTMYNRDRVSMRIAAQGKEKAGEGDYSGARRDFTHVLSRLFTGVVITALIHDIVKGQGRDKKDWIHGFIDAIAERLAAPIPVVRDLVGGLTTGFDFESSPLSSVGKELTQAGKDILHKVEGQRLSARWIQHAANTVGYLFALPLGQAGTTSQFLHDFATGRERPKDFGQFVHGLIFGRSK